MTVVGKRRDKNGNRTIRLGFPDGKGFSIQTNGNLPETHSIFSRVKRVDMLTGEELDVIEKEVIRYVEAFGTKRQKDLVGVEKKAKGGKTRSTHAINQDRKRLSQEPWEQAYKKKRKGDYYEPEKKEEGGSIKMNNLDWGKTTTERNSNLDYYNSLETIKEKEDFKRKLKSKNESVLKIGDTVKYPDAEYTGEIIELKPSTAIKGEVEVTVLYRDGKMVKDLGSSFVKTKAKDISSINPKSFTLNDIINTVSDVDVTMIRKGTSLDSADKRDISWRLGDGSKKYREWFSKEWTISDYAIIEASKGSENLYADIVVYFNNEEDGDIYQAYTVSLYSKNNVKGLKSLISHFVQKMEKGGKTRSTHAINQDRRRLSQEPWEQAYKKKRKGDYYEPEKKEKGGSLGEDNGRISKSEIKKQGYTTTYDVLGEDIIGKEVTVSHRKEKGIVDGFKDLGDSNYEVLIWYPELGFSEAVNTKFIDVRFVEEFKDGGSVFVDLFAKGGEVKMVVFQVKKPNGDWEDRKEWQSNETYQNDLEQMQREYKQDLPNFKTRVIERSFTFAKGGEVEGELKGEIIKEVNSKVWTLQLYDDNGYHSSIYAPKKSDLTQYMREQGIKKYAKGGEVDNSYPSIEVVKHIKSLDLSGLESMKSELEKEMSKGLLKGRKHDRELSLIKREIRKRKGDLTDVFESGGEIESAYVDYLNDIGDSYDYESDEWIIGGENRADEYWGRYGEALRDHDPIGFEVGKNEFERDVFAKGGSAKGLSQEELEQIASDFAYVTGGDEEKAIYRLVDPDYTDTLLPKYKKAIEEWEQKHGEKVSVYNKGGVIKSKGWFKGSLSFLNW